MSQITSTKLLIFITLITIIFPQIASAEVIFATVNGIGINQSTFDYMAKSTIPSGQELTDSVKTTISKKLIDSELLYQQAQKLGLDKQDDYIAREALLHRDASKSSAPDFKVREEIARHELLTKTYYQYFLKENPIPEAEIRAAYDEYVKKYGANEFNTLHILVKTEAEAKNIIEQLNRGDDFSIIAKDKSIDDGSKEKGGGLGWVNPSSMPKSFGDALILTPNDSVSSFPVQTNWGWHVIKVVGIRAALPIPYSNMMKSSLQRSLEVRSFEKLVDDLRSKAKIVIN